VPRIATAATAILVALAFAQAGSARAQGCAPLADGTLLCERDGVVALVDPASGESVELTEELLAALLSAALAEPERQAAAAPEEAPEQGGTFEDRITGLCASGDCPAGLTGAIDQLNGYVPSYQ
jgi:hypothetical protein